MIEQLDFSVAALFAACLANVFAAFRANENKKLMDTVGLKVCLKPDFLLFTSIEDRLVQNTGQFD